MNAVFKTFLSMSFSGSLLILALIFGKRFWKDRLSRQWQYYIWLIVILRLLLPFEPGTSLMGRAFKAVGQARMHSVPLVLREDMQGDVPVAGKDPEDGSAGLTGDRASARPVEDAWVLLFDHIWLVWSMGAVSLMIRKITIYQDFVRYVKAGSTPVADIGMLDQLCIAAGRESIKRPIELCIDPLVSSPLLIGFFRPCIVLPRADISEKDLQYIILHELTHYKRRDMFYKWLVQITVCLHWFDPLVHLMSREIARDCEFSCDETVLSKAGYGNAQEYGRTLLDAMASVGRYKEDVGAVTLSEDKQLLKERLSAIMGHKKKSAAIRILTGALTLCAVLGAAFIGVYPVTAASDQTTSVSVPPSDRSKDADLERTDAYSDRYSLMAEQYYEAGSLPLFQMAFRRLDAQEQGRWLDRIYEDDQIAFFGAAVALLDEDCAQIQHLAETVYGAGDIVYFSTLAMHMSKDTLEDWLYRALEDGDWVFQSVLSDALDVELDDGLDEKEWERERMAEYGAVGITINGKDYRYEGQLVDIFLDIRSDKSFYTLDMNPAGTINIKIVRDEDDEITGVAYMTEAEVQELFGDM